KPFYFVALTLSIILLVAGLFFAWMSSRADSAEAMASRVSDRLAGELEVVDEELRTLLGGPFDISRAMATETTYPFFIYEGNQLRYWSDNEFVPPPVLPSDTFFIRLLRIGRESYLVRQDRMDDQHYVVSLIALMKQYTIVNDYLDT